MADELERYLEQLRGEGRPDSRGHFTLDRFRAQALLGQFQKGNPKHYLFHIVRAGVAARSRKIVVLSEQDRLEVRFEGPAPLAFEQRLMKSLESPWGLPQGSALAHLARGILASAELRPHRMEWNTWDGSRGSQLLWDESGLSVGNFKHAHQSGFSFVLLGASRDPQAEIQALAENYGFTNIPLFLGKETLPCQGRDWLHPSLCDGGDDRLPAGFRLAEAYGPPGPRQQLYLPEASGRARMTLWDGPKGVVEKPLNDWGPASDSPLVLYLPPEHTRGSASAVAVGWHLRGDGRVIWVQNGLRLSELFLDMGCPGSVAVSEVDGLTLDAGGTQIVDDRVYRHRVRDLRESIKTLWPTIPKYLPLLQFRAASESGFLSRLFQSPERNLTSQEKALQADIRARLPRYQL